MISFVERLSIDMVWEDGAVVEAETQSLAEAFSKPFPLPDKTNIAGYPASAITDTVVTMSDVMQRNMFFVQPTTENTPYVLDSPLRMYQSAGTGFLVASFGAIFRFWRGSRIWRMLSNGSHAVLFVGDKCWLSPVGAIGGNSFATIGTTSGFVIPWNCITGDFTFNNTSNWVPDSSWFPTYTALSRYRNGTVPTILQEYITFGDDYQVGGLAPPPYLVI